MSALHGVFGEAVCGLMPTAKEISEELKILLEEKRWKEAEAETWRLAAEIQKELDEIEAKYGLSVHKIYIRSQPLGKIKELKK